MVAASSHRVRRRIWKPEAVSLLIGACMYTIDETLKKVVVTTCNEKASQFVMSAFTDLFENYKIHLTMV